MLYDSNICHSERVKLWRQYKDQRLEKGGVNKQSAVNFYGTATILYNAITVDMFYYTFGNTYRMYSAINEI